MTARRLVALALPVLLVGLACGPGPSGNKMSIVSGDKQSAFPDTTLPSKLVVLVKNSKGAVASLSVSFVVPGGLGTVSPATTTTDAQGHASTALSVGPNLGPVTVVANAGPNVSVTFSATVQPRPPKSFAVSGFPSPVPVGTRASFDLAALDASGNVASTYSGTVHFTSSDPKAALPADATLNDGVGRFFATLNTVGTQSITATDTQDSTFTGSQTGIVVTGGPAAKLVVSGYPSPEAVGASASFTVTAVDVQGNRSHGYAGTIHFTSTDAAAVLPADSTLTGGRGTFMVAMGTVGTQTLTATDTDHASITGSQTGIVVIPGAPAQLAFVTQPSDTETNGTVTPAVQVAVEDAKGNVVTDSTAPITLALGNNVTNAALSGTLTQKANAGLASFGDLSLDKMGTYTLIANAADLPPATSDSFMVRAGVAAKLVVSGFPTTVNAGQSDGFTVTAIDAHGNVATTYQGTVHFTSSDSKATLPADTTLTSGTGTFSANLNTAGTQSITATDTTDAGISGTEGGITVNAGAATALVVSGFPSPITVGSSGGFTVTAVDAEGNIVTTFEHIVQVTSNSDPNATFSPASTILTQGSGTFSATFATPGTQSITATDLDQADITGTQSGIVVNASTP